MPPLHSNVQHKSPVAQLVEQRTVNPPVVGSSPTRGAKFKKASLRRLFLFLASQYYDSVFDDLFQIVTKSIADLCIFKPIANGSHQKTHFSTAVVSFSFE